MTSRVRASKGVLLILTGFFVASGAIRLGTEAGQVLAAGAEEVSSDAMAPPDESVVLEGSPSELAADLLARERRVRELELQIEDRFRALALAEEQITAQLSELREAEASLQDAIAGAETASSSDLSRLVSVYENMKPAEAAALFEEMTPNFAAGFIGAMRPDAAASILAGLEPTTAYAISVVLAGRNAEVPTE